MESGIKKQLLTVVFGRIPFPRHLWRDFTGPKNHEKPATPHPYHIPGNKTKKTGWKI
jgi:hypothetical protein